MFAAYTLKNCMYLYGDILLIEKKIEKCYEVLITKIIS